jgi:hypothetical protein
MLKILNTTFEASVLRNELLHEMFIDYVDLIWIFTETFFVLEKIYGIFGEFISKCIRHMKGITYKMFVEYIDLIRIWTLYLKHF